MGAPSNTEQTSTSLRNPSVLDAQAARTCAVSPPSGWASMRANISVIMMSSSRGVDSFDR
jgi:hypothetical protein